MSKTKEIIKMEVKNVHPCVCLCKKDTSVLFSKVIVQ